MLAGPRIESSFEVINRSPDAVISDVAYPSYAFARLTGGNDTMVYPWMSGVLVKNPMEEQFIFGQEGVFPSGRIPLQFAAYYDDANGIYFGVEDGLARTKRYSATGKRGNLNIVWSSPVPAAVDGRGGNSFKLNGKAVIELYSGKWFEAGRIYRRFLEKEAAIVDSGASPQGYAGMVSRQYLMGSCFCRECRQCGADEGGSRLSAQIF